LGRRRSNRSPLPDHAAAIPAELQASINQEFAPGGAHTAGTAGLGSQLGNQDLYDADALPGAGAFARMTAAQQKTLEDFAKRPADPQQ